MTRSPLHPIAGAMLLALTALLLPACKDRSTSADHTDPPAHAEHADEVKLTDESIQRHGIRVEPAVSRVLAPTFTAPARVAFNAEAMAHVGSPLRGRAVEIKVRQGDQVSKD